MFVCKNEIKSFIRALCRALNIYIVINENSIMHFIDIHCVYKFDGRFGQRNIEAMSSVHQGIRDGKKNKERVQ